MLNHPACHACDKTTAINVDAYQSGQTIHFNCSKCDELNEFDVQKPIDNAERLASTKTIREIIQDHKTAEKWLLIAALAAFLASSFFVIKYFVAGEMSPNIWTGEQWINALIAVTITAVITAAQMQLYASGYKTPMSTMAITILVFFGLFSEISQSMERDDANVRQRSSESDVYQAVVKSITVPTNTTITLPSSLQRQIDMANNALITATGTRARYESELRNKNENKKSSERDFPEIRSDITRAQGIEAAAQAKVDTLNRQAQMYLGAQSDAGAKRTDALVNQAKALQYDENQQYSMIRLIKHFFNTSALIASFIFSVIIIGTFEFAFHFIGAYVADHRTALKRAGRDKRGELLPDNNPPTPPAPKKPIPTFEKAPDTNNIHSLNFGKSSYGGNAFASGDQMVSAPTATTPPQYAGNTAIKAQIHPAATLHAAPAVVSHINTHPHYQRGRILDTAQQTELVAVPSTPHRDVTPHNTDTDKRNVTPQADDTPDTLNNAYLEIARAIHHNQIKTPSFRPCIKVLSAAKIGANANERQAIITDVMETFLKPENIVIDHPEKGKAGKPNWVWHPEFTRKPENWNIH